MPAPSRRALILAVALGLAACSSPPPRPTYPDIRFTDEPPLRLAIASVEVHEDYQMPFKEPNVEHLFPVPPSRALENWAHDRLRATGNNGTAIFSIRVASVVETELPVNQGVTGVFTTQASERYDLTITAALTIMENGLAVHTANVTTTRSQSLLQGITPNDRDKAWYEMTKTAMADFDKQMESEMRNTFGDYLER
ncbi:MAG TPA: hypothetical protein VLV50_14990 [Stellaceae bacterium]|nr:hypothetical protein [Stellaceae bacterium]